MTPPDDDLSPGELLPAGRRFRIVLVLGLLTALGPLTIDMYLPSLPAITGDLHTTPASVQLTLTGTLVGLAFGQLLVGRSAGERLTLPAEVADRIRSRCVGVP